MRKMLANMKPVGRSFAETPELVRGWGGDNHGNCGAILACDDDISYSYSAHAYGLGVGSNQAGGPAQRRARSGPAAFQPGRPLRVDRNGLQRLTTSRLIFAAELATALAIIVRLAIL